jgi:predicted metalloprotease with PDZ domain
MFEAGATTGATIVAVNGRQYSNDLFREAIRIAHDGRAPIRLLIKRGERYTEVALDYHGGLRYPVLERVGTGPSSLDALLAPL